MRRSVLGISAFTFSAWLALVGCGESSSDPGGTAGSGGDGDAGSTAGAGKPSGGSAAGGSNGNAGKPSGGSAQGGTGAGGGDTGDAGAPEPGGDAGGPASGGGAGGLVECDPKQALCKLLPGECPPMQAREVVGTCWGECVKIDRCACGSASDCPNPNEFTCWMGTHCGPYVK